MCECNKLCDEKVRVLVKEIMKIRYFYCSSENCDNIKDYEGIFCDEHTIYNVKKLRENPFEISRVDVKKMALRSISKELAMTDIKVLCDRKKYCKML